MDEKQLKKSTPEDSLRELFHAINAPSGPNIELLPYPKMDREPHPLQEYVQDEDESNDF